MKYFANAKCEIKCASKHLRSKYFIRVSVFHSKAISLAAGEFHGKRKDTLSRVFLFLEATPGFEPGNQGFADPCLTTWLCRHRCKKRHT